MFRNTIVGAVAAAAAIAVATVAATGALATAGTSHKANRSVTAAAPQVAGGVGWQGEYAYNVPAGETSVLVHYPWVDSSGYRNSSSARRSVGL